MCTGMLSPKLNEVLVVLCTYIQHEKFPARPRARFRDAQNVNRTLRHEHFITLSPPSQRHSAMLRSAKKGAHKDNNRTAVSACRRRVRLHPLPLFGCNTHTIVQHAFWLVGTGGPTYTTSTHFAGRVKSARQAHRRGTDRHRAGAPLLHNP